MTTKASPFRSWRHRLGALILLAAMIQAPWLYGAATTRSVAWLLLLISVSLALAPPVRKPGVGAALLLIAMTFSVWIASALAQLLWWPSEAGLAGIPIWLEADRALGTVGAARMTLGVNGFLDAFSRAALVAGTLASGLLHGQDRDSAIRALRWLVVTGVITVVIAMALHVIHPGYVLWQKKLAYLNSFTGPFIHRGAAGAWQSVIAVTALLLGLRALHRQYRDVATENETRISAILRAILQDPVALIVYLLAFTVGIVGLLMTQSRAALIMLGFQLIILLVLLPTVKVLNWRFVTLVSVATVFLFVLLFNWAGRNVSVRLEEDGLFEAGRWEIWSATIASIAQRPWTGWGAGGFTEGFAMERGPDLASLGLIQSAHSLPLELAFEMGIPITVLLIMAWFCIVRLLLVALLRNRRLDVVVLSGLLAALGAVVVVSIDVVSSVYGYVLPMLALVGLALAQRHYYARTDEDDLAA